MVRLDTTTVGSGFIGVGLAHLLAPRVLLATARYAYRRLLAADFDVNERTERRVRAIGLVMLALGTIVATANRSVSVVIDRT
ncbi:hypothetical protein HAPAU_16410 [Halalkalicoccus paucihalophilus]|jgi:hypothetical protein|uniref:Uncharacterized protein n=1 Tax=Halalkalicoccus paucihalophilus TaxID=1008153 RepID=A0A151AG68_9EURY|nr:hypothetical protein [Halalkalicoccus paucihalophilus]KYH26542.1 hypothetical protein HAPAU_16410 [Halalkalicoccus paucihalophilus]